MVKFTKNSFIIEITTHTNPTEEWLNLHNEITTVLSLIDEQSNNPPPSSILYLLESMMPDWETAKKMTNK